MLLFFFFSLHIPKVFALLDTHEILSEVEELRLEDEAAMKILKICDPLYETSEVMNINVLLNF